MAKDDPETVEVAEAAAVLTRLTQITLNGTGRYFARLIAARERLS